MENLGISYQSHRSGSVFPNDSHFPGSIPHSIRYRSRPAPAPASQEEDGNGSDYAPFPAQYPSLCYEKTLNKYVMFTFFTSLSTENLENLTVDLDNLFCSSHEFHRENNAL